MCNAYPGLRCTNHARKKLIEAQVHLKELEAQYEKKRGMPSEELIEARRTHADALMEWDMSAGGQKALKEAVARKEAEHKALKERDGYAVHHLPEELKEEHWQVEQQLGNLRYRLRESKEKREKRLRLARFYKRHEKGEKFPLAERWDQDHKLDASWTTEDGDEIRVYNQHPWDPRRAYAKCVWRIRDGEPVAMIRFFDRSFGMYGDKAVLCDIEVSPFYRGNGLGVKTIEEINKQYGQLHTSGTYSVSGHRSLGKHLPLHEGAEVRVSHQTTHYEFVDWEQGDLMSW